MRWVLGVLSVTLTKYPLLLLVYSDPRRIRVFLCRMSTYLRSAVDLRIKYPYESLFYAIKTRTCSVAILPISFNEVRPRSPTPLHIYFHKSFPYYSKAFSITRIDWPQIVDIDPPYISTGSSQKSIDRRYPILKWPTTSLHAIQFERNVRSNHLPCLSTHSYLDEPPSNISQMSYIPYKGHHVINDSALPSCLHR